MLVCIYACSEKTSEERAKRMKYNVDWKKSTIHNWEKSASRCVMLCRQTFILLRQSRLPHNFFSLPYSIFVRLFSSTFSPLRFQQPPSNWLYSVIFIITVFFVIIEQFVGCCVYFLQLTSPFHRNNYMKSEKNALVLWYDMVFEFQMNRSLARCFCIARLFWVWSLNGHELFPSIDTTQQFIHFPVFHVLS